MEAIASIISEVIETTPSAPPAAPTLINGSHALMKALIAEGVDTILGIPAELLCLYTTRYMIIRSS